MGTNRDQAVARAFARFAKAAQTGDVAAYRAMVVRDAPPEEGLFARNSDKVRRRGLDLTLRSVEYQGEVAEARFALVDSAGRNVGEGRVVFTEEADGWRVRAL